MTIKNRYEGDPKLTLGPNGSNVEYIGGQPVMDQGLENSVLIDLFTKSKGRYRNKKGWWGNLLTENPLEKIGSSYVDDVINQPLTLKGLSNIEQSAGKALKDPIYGKKSSVVNNPESNRIDNSITVGSPGEDVELLLTTTNSVNWKAQANNPAHLDLTEQ